MKMLGKMKARKFLGVQWHTKVSQVLIWFDKNYNNDE